MVVKSFLVEDNGMVLEPAGLNLEKDMEEEVKENVEQQAPVDDDFDVIDVSSVPIPPTEVREVVEDEIGKPTAFKLAILGSGQGGGRLAQQFWQLGYRRVAAVNTAQADIRPLNLPEDRKLVMDSAGAGGKLEVGARVTADHREDIHDLLRKSFGTDFDRALITVTAGGGTGSGSVFELVKIVGDYMDKAELRKAGGDPRVGVLVALPKESDGKRAHHNAFVTFQELYRRVPHEISPLIVIDNQRISKLYPNLSVDMFWTVANKSVCSIFHLLNLVSARHSEYTSFDPADFETVLQSGMLAFGATPVQNWSEREAMGQAIRDNLKRNVLVSGLDLGTGTVAGCVVVAHRDTLKALKQESLDDGFSMLGRMLQSGSAVYRGIYAGNNSDPVVYTLIGGLKPPADRLSELQRLGGVTDWDDA